MTTFADESPAFDHLLHWVPDVPAAVEAYRAVDLPAHAHDALSGFQNGGWRLDERYVEILTVTDEEELRSSRYAEGLALLRPAIDALGGSGGAITFSVNVRDVRATAERLREQGHRVEEFAVTLEEHGVSFVEAFVLDGPAWAPFFITYDPPRERLLADIPPGSFSRGPHDLAGLVVETPDPEGAAGYLAALLGCERDGWRVPLPGAEVTFERGDREGIVALTLREGPPRPPAEVEGLTLRFEG
ncbi:VOC family protein [Streptomyces sp. NPDC005438]|uniref:VOC family protein n=1 Tax=Streptomyces sp. NPDC005438 TaxID=3156880 RepID=UPI0033B58902